MRRFIMLYVGLGLYACGPTTTGPGKISGFGLVYDQRPGFQFEGLPETTLAQMSETVGTMTGPSRIQSDDGTMVFADASLTVDVATMNVTYEGTYTFPDDHPIGVVQVQIDGTLNGMEIESTDPTDNAYLSGDFYGEDGSVAAGFFSQGGPGEEAAYFSGAYIVSSE